MSETSSSEELLLYQAVGRKVRAVRERMTPKMTQTQLAKKLGVSRVSIVNIEAGRQHAPLHFLWHLAEQLGTELVMLIPRQDEFRAQLQPVKLDEETIQQIEAAASGNPVTRHTLETFVSKVRARRSQQQEAEPIVTKLLPSDGKRI